MTRRAACYTVLLVVSLTGYKVSRCEPPLWLADQAAVAQPPRRQMRLLCNRTVGFRAVTFSLPCSLPRASTGCCGRARGTYGPVYFVLATSPLGSAEGISGLIFRKWRDTFGHYLSKSKPSVGSSQVHCNDTDFVIFSRIPKTGGTMLRQYIYNSTQPEDKKYIYGDTERLAGISMKKALENGTHLLYTVHSKYGAHRIGKHPCCYISVLRHPLRRAISDYYHDGRHAGSNISTLESHLLNMDSTAANRQARILCPMVTAAGNLTTNNRKLYQCARENMLSCYVMGSLDSLLPTIRLFARAYPRWFGSESNVPYSFPSIRSYSGTTHLFPDNISRDFALAFIKKAWVDFALWSEVEESLKPFERSVSGVQ